MSCVKGAQSIVNIINNVADTVVFWAPTVMLCSGPKSVQYGADYITISARCISEKYGTWHKVTIIKAGGALLFYVGFPGIYVEQGWGLYVTVTLRWA